MSEVTNEQTKMVHGFFGKEKPMTRAYYVKMWKDHALQLTNLADTSAEYGEFEHVAEDAAIKAGRQWDRLAGVKDESIPGITVI